MALKTFKPVTPSLRQLVIVDRSALYKGKPVKTLTEGKHESGGRNNTGRITVRFRGGGHKQSYRVVDFKRSKLDVSAVVERIEYDPNRTAFIALVKYTDGTQAKQCPHLMPMRRSCAACWSFSSWQPFSRAPFPALGLSGCRKPRQRLRLRPWIMRSEIAAERARAAGC
jgi:hypothetical protein